MIDNVLTSLLDREMRFKSPFEKKKLSQGNPEEKTRVDIIELKNRLATFANC